MNLVSFLQELIRCPSVTPTDAGVMDIVERELTALGFSCERMFFGTGEDETQNLYAKKGSGNPHFCFMGHVDVVPVSGQAWKYAPFAAEIDSGRLYGRGAMDMKSGIACFIDALNGFEFDGTISLLITGNEEGVPTYGSPAVIKELVKRGETWTAAIVGEPCGTEQTGSIIKIGRRGILNCELTVTGVCGHTGYTQLAINPVEGLCDILAEVRKPLDYGTADFEPSTLAVTSIDVGNKTTNVIPQKAYAKFNCRFNDTYTAETLSALLHERISKVASQIGVKFDFKAECVANVFVCKDEKLIATVTDAIREVTGLKTAPSTAGGSSDARFIYNYCPVLECGISGRNMHGADESVAVSDLETQSLIYRRILEKFFKG